MSLEVAQLSATTLDVENANRARAAQLSRRLLRQMAQQILLFKK
jgi:hypothetical protein